MESPEVAKLMTQLQSDEPADAGAILWNKYGRLMESIARRWLRTLPSAAGEPDSVANSAFLSFLARAKTNSLDELPSSEQQLRLELLRATNRHVRRRRLRTIAEAGWQRGETENVASRGGTEADEEMLFDDSLNLLFERLKPLLKEEVFTAMMMSHSGATIQTIAKSMNRSPSTIGRYLKLATKESLRILDRGLE